MMSGVKRGSNAQQHFQPVSIEVNASSPTPPATNQQVSNLSGRRLSAINLNSMNTSPSPTMSNNINTISGMHVPYSGSAQPTSNKNQHLRSVQSTVQSSGAINELGLVSSPTQQSQLKTPRTRSSISNLLMSPKLNTSNFDYQQDSGQANNNDFEFQNLNFTSNQMSSGLRAPAYNKGRKYSCVAAINPIHSDSFATHSYLPNQIAKSRRHSRAVADIPSPSQLRSQERKQSNIVEYDSNLINQQQQLYSQNERNTLNRKKYSLANHGSNQDFGGVVGQHLINKPLIQTQKQEHQVRKFSNSSTPSSSRKQSRADQQYQQREEEQAMIQDYNEQQFEAEQYSNSSNYQKRHSSHQLQSQHYHPIDQQQQPEFNQHFEDIN